MNEYIVEHQDGHSTRVEATGYNYTTTSVEFVQIGAASSNGGVARVLGVQSFPVINVRRVINVTNKHLLEDG